MAYIPHQMVMVAWHCFVVTGVLEQWSFGNFKIEGFSLLLPLLQYSITPLLHYSIRLVN
jgi:hypothetical protein